MNIDGLHEKAGSKKIIDIHNGLKDYYCMSCLKTYQHAEVDYSEGVPICNCGGVIRPNVVLYGEMLDQKKLAELQKELEIGIDIVFAVGVGNAFPYIMKAISEVRHKGGLAVEINIADTDCSHLFDVHMHTGARLGMISVLEVGKS
jgi:NAD-dependent deacetylase